MTDQRDKRKWLREKLSEPSLGVLFDMSDANNDALHPIFAGVRDESDTGFQLETALPLDPAANYLLLVNDLSSDDWRQHPAQAVWSAPAPCNTKNFCGISCLPESAADTRKSLAPEIDTVLTNIDFLLTTPLLKELPAGAIWPLLSCLSPMQLTPGEKIICQGEEGDCLFLIQKGHCLVMVEKGGVMHRVDRCGTGEVLGEMALLTGATRTADVVAEDLATIWILTNNHFQELAGKFPDLRMFLTELLSHRLAKSSIIAERTVGKYRIKSKIAQGGWGIVYRGVNLMLGMPVAIKMLKHQMAMKPSFQQPFKREAKIIARLHHPSIVRVFDILEMYQTIFIVMEYLEGESLEDLLTRRGALPHDLTVTILNQVASGLAYAHKEGIIHHDIKPANILLTEEGRAKILDFGLAIVSGEEKLPFMGTIEYMAPEQLNGGTTDQRVDIYTLGLTAYEMATGKKPWPSDDISQALERRLNEDFLDPARHAPDIPEPLREFIRKACRPDPEDRFRTMEEVLAILTPLTEIKPDAKRKNKRPGNLAALMFFFRQDQQKEMTQMLEDFHDRAEELGIRLKSQDFDDI